MKPLSITIGSIYVFLGAVCVYWGITNKDTASGLAVVVGAILSSYGAKLIYLTLKK